MSRTGLASVAGPLPEALHVLVVDDSAVVRAVVGEILRRRGGHRVTVAADPIIARDLLGQSRPDVILLDIEMPRLDGLTFLRELMEHDAPVPVVVCSSHAAEGGQMAVRALEEGAVEVIAKPRIGLQAFLQESARQLVDAVEAAAVARPRPRRARSAMLATVPGAGPSPPVRTASAVASRTIVALGASTGGTDAIARILSEMPEQCPGMVVVQHMPAPFTAAFAERLDQQCRIEVREAVDGDLVAHGTALIAPGDRHLRVVRRGRGFHVALDESAPVSRHRPSVDVLFHSIAAAAGTQAIAALLTGMGDDGAQGLLAIRNARGRTLAQDAESSIVFGMPGAAIARGAASEVVSLGNMAARLLSRPTGSQ